MIYLVNVSKLEAAILQNKNNKSLAQKFDVSMVQPRYLISF